MRSFVRMRDAYRKSCLFPVHMAEVQVRCFLRFFLQLYLLNCFNIVCCVNKSYIMRTLVTVIRVGMYLLE